MENYFGKFHENIDRAERRLKAAEAVQIALDLLTSGRPIIVGDMPLETLVAEQLELENANRIAGQHEVRELLKDGQEVLELGLDQVKATLSNSREMLLHETELSGPVQDQMH